MPTYGDLKRLGLVRLNGYEIGTDDLKHMVIDGKDETRFGRRVDQPKKITLSFLKDLGEGWLAVFCRNAPRRRIRQCTIGIKSW